MKNIDILYKELDKKKDFDENERNAGEFLDLFDEIILQKNPSSLKYLVSYFDDNSEYSWVMESMKCAIESYPDELYVEHFLKILPVFLKKSPFWCGVLLNRLINNEACLIILRKKINFLNANTMINILKILEKEYPNQECFIEFLRKEINE